MSVKPSRGVIHGKTIELLEDLGLTEGQEVDVIVRVRKTRPEWGQGILNSAGAMALYWTSEDDRILDEIEQDRRQPSTREIPE
ncbi:hypothetical protein [Singulisphaera acidiphila]|uniref:Uncharacterized protein n=1 Tax=Singulisphaera acidiphila (strain ATCC BAA-1392 / DSM 18658 / VKM B-2454 / MOB10) TaxID=886293 RepID=L0DLN1_SINAD|nr:hypothetical protein [Singulisphaera acidiphila]AGA30294.1 hypothetical protein Sinac_6196 [Singulisphaera acidiphila DSM 18658]